MARRPGANNPESVAFIRNLIRKRHLSGCDPLQIAERLGVHHSYVREELKRMKLTPHPAVDLYDPPSP